MSENNESMSWPRKVFLRLRPNQTTMVVTVTLTGTVLFMEGMFNGQEKHAEVGQWILTTGGSSGVFAKFVYPWIVKQLGGDETAEEIVEQAIEEQPEVVEDIENAANRARGELVDGDEFYSTRDLAKD